MAEQTHTHEQTSETHTADTPRAVVGPGAGAVAARVLLTVLGAAGMIVGAFLEWTGGERGTDLSYRVFFEPLSETNANFFGSAGFVIIAVAVLALLGLAGNWLTRLAGALGIAVFILFAISVYRAETTSTFFESIHVGAWVVLAGSVVALIGGFAGTRRVVALPA